MGPQAVPRAHDAKLSVQSLETLAVIAYKQPVTAPEIAEIRGVSSSSGVLQTLIERKLVKTVGRKPVVGRPFMYGTTREFLERFGLNDIADLPKVDELSDALGFELPAVLAEPTMTTSPLPFEAGADESTGRVSAQTPEPVDETAHLITPRQRCGRPKGLRYVCQLRPAAFRSLFSSRGA